MSENDYSKPELLVMTVEIVKEYAKGGGNQETGLVLKDVYETLKEINKDLDNEE